MQLTKEQFKENLLNAIGEVINNTGNKDYRFIITPVAENNVKYNSTDDYIRLWLLNEKNVQGRYFDTDQAVIFLAQPNYKYPNWIKIKRTEETETHFTFELQISMRFRPPTQLKYIETGHPPFLYER
jgi:hypothetical protein